MKPIEFYDTRGRSQRVFEPIEAGRVGIYTCGPTVYAPQHVGNMRSRLLPDLLKRFLQSEGYVVTLVINITDVGHLVADADEGEDKMEAAARLAGRGVEEIAEFYTQSWLDDSAAINCLPPDVNPKATEHIEEQIELAKRLDERGYLYTIQDGVYFDTSLFPRYAELADLDLEGQEEGARIGVTKGKRNPSDFAVWKFADPEVKRLQEWDSPWGRGFPGWHLECSAMSVRYLGEHFDIHTAGIDLATVHHSNEVAQTECGFGVHPSVEFWMHNEFLDMGGEKMSKSKGNVKTISDLVDRGIDPMAFRYFFLQAHYRQQQNYNAESIESAAKGLRRLQKIGSELESVEGEGSEQVQAAYRERFRNALADDLNAPRAMAVVWEVARSDTLADVDRRDLLRAFDVVLGLRLADGAAADQDSEWEQDPEITGMLAERQAAREAKDWASADRIRDALSAMNIEIVDTPDGPRWRRSGNSADAAKSGKGDGE